MVTKKIILFIFLYSFSNSLFAQDTDSIIGKNNIKELEEVIVIDQKDISGKHSKALSSLDNFLESNNAINMIKRGAYAWEAAINGMSTERSVITIDGMRIYGACTDKMDPITSYVEITNLSKAVIKGGQGGGAHGATIAGSIDLIRQHSNFDNSGLKGSIFTGFETNNLQKIAGAKLDYSTKKFYSDFDFTIRDAENYKAGGNEEILYSQFSKFNMSANVGRKINEHQDLSASVIYDRAWDVGYPALPMDVSLAEAFMGSVKFQKHHISSYIHHWESKLYFNKVIHIMDDTKRPIVPIRMDMPGWTSTGGFYSFINGERGKHNWKASVNGHINRSYAEMTMYPADVNEKDMFMLTWPDVSTYFASVFLEDNYYLDDNWSSNLSIGSSIQTNTINDSFGIESLRIFHPDLNSIKTRWLKNIGYSMNYYKRNQNINFGLAYSERAPSVSEAYGFYLFNSFDRYDYIGDPNLNNEKSIELNAAYSIALKKGFVKVQANYFRMYDYIIGKIQPGLTPMTINANGIKKYEALENANIFNANLSLNYNILKQVNASFRLIYRYGQGNDLPLPLIQPFSYGAVVRYEPNKYVFEINMEGALKQINYSTEYGETPAPAYTIFNLSASRDFSFLKQTILLKTGIENLFDTHYSTFADWNRIPRMGRNVFVNVIYKF
ncbi:MAG TPA: hypothetical protein VLZ83_02440 [Edaphocola sp.]|nr:hypothetical protein [Edaphocola sp.]